MQIKLQVLIFAVQQNNRTMLKLEELCARNWVQYNCEALQIDEIVGQYATFYRHENVHYTHLQPLPITPEWLEALGFKKDEKLEGYFEVGDSVYYFDDDTLHIYYNKDADIWTCNGLQVAAIHQIQNIATIKGITPTKP